MKTLRSELPFGFRMRMSTTVKAMQIDTGAAARSAADNLISATSASLIKLLASACADLCP